MFLVIDIGNTSQKIAVFNADGQEVLVSRYDKLDINKLQVVFEQYPIEAALLSVVGHVDADLVDWLESQTTLVRFSPTLKLPMQLNYKTPETLGTDRIAAAAGAQALFPGQNTLVIQAGTCLVTDFVDADNVYQGGSIAPGMRMRFRALHEHTAHLPLLEPLPIDYFTGKSTQESICSGVIQGMVCEIEGIIRHYDALYPNFNTILTGGDADFLKSFIKNRIFAAPNLVLYGLYKILRNNVE